MKGARSETILALVRETLAYIETHPERLSAAVRKATRVARLATYYYSLFWLQYELIDTNVDGSVEEIATELLKNVGKDHYEPTFQRTIDRYNEERKYWPMDSQLRRQSEPMYANVSLEQLERAVEVCRRQQSDPDGRIQFHAQHMESEYARIFAIIRQRVYNLLTKIEHQLETGEVNADIFAAYRADVDRSLGEIAPDVLAQFVSVYRRIKEDDPEARSQALSSCRRILNAIADLVYPANSDPYIDTQGKPHKVDAENYINRLWAFVAESGKRDRSRDLLRAQIGDVEKRLDALQALSSKGTHARVSVAELNQCAIQTYLVAGDILRLYEQSQNANT